MILGKASLLVHLLLSRLCVPGRRSTLPFMHTTCHSSARSFGPHSTSPDSDDDALDNLGNGENRAKTMETVDGGEDDYLEDDTFSGRDDRYTTTSAFAVWRCWFTTMPSFRDL